MKKGAIQPLSAVMITLIMIGIIGSVYFWGVPLINKRQDITTLRNAERFMRGLDTSIKNVANQGGRDSISMNVPGIIEFDGSEIRLRLATSGTIYATGGMLPLNQYGCSDSERALGTDSSEIFCVQSNDLGGVFDTTYFLKYVPLKDAVSIYIIDFEGSSQIGAENDNIIVENDGTVQNGKNFVTKIKVTIS